MLSSATRLVAAAVLVLAIPARAAPTGLWLGIESGPAYVLQNDGRYGPGGTLFHADELGEQRVLAVLTRISAEVRVGESHGLELLYVPVSLETQASVDHALTFRGTTFDPRTPLLFRYVFDGYRLSYFYRLVDAGAWRLDVGGAFQLRSATVELSDVAGTRLATDSNIGPVFALAVRLRRRVGTSAFAELNVTGFSTFGRIGSTQGTILDAQLALGSRLRPDVETFAGLRVYGGGVDNLDRSLYNFAWFGQASLGVRADLSSLFGSTGSHSDSRVVRPGEPR